MYFAHFRKFSLSNIIAFSAVLFCVEGLGQGPGRKGRLIHGKYFGPVNETSLFSKDIRIDQIEIGWISQPLDHFNKNDIRKWNQKFARNGTFFRTGGPACIMISGESAMDPRWIVLGHAVKYCQNFNAVMYMLEHRYYGDSKPTVDASVDNLKYLTISQALQDIARFIEYVKLKDKVGKVILFGGSYAGTLVAYFKQKFPKIADISVASSGPIVWKFDFIEYMEVVGKLLRQYWNCYDRINSGMKVIERIVSEAIASKYEGPMNPLLHPLKLCTDLYTINKMDVLNFYSALFAIFQYYTQYNGANSELLTMEEICKTVSIPGKNASESEDFEVITNLVQRLYLSLDSDCIDFSNQDYCDFMAKTSWQDPAVAHGGRIWNWQVCSEVASFQTTNSKNQPFFGITTDLFVEQCQCIFGKKFTGKFTQNAVEHHTQVYGGYQAVRPNVIYINGEFDPWSALSVVNKEQILPFVEDSTASISKNCVILIRGASHCSDMSPARPNDSLDLQHARNETLRCITKWM